MGKIRGAHSVEKREGGVSGRSFDVAQASQEAALVHSDLGKGLVEGTLRHVRALVACKAGIRGGRPGDSRGPEHWACPSLNLGGQGWGMQHASLDLIKTKLCGAACRCGRQASQPGRAARGQHAHPPPCRPGRRGCWCCP